MISKMIINLSLLWWVTKFLERGKHASCELLEWLFCNRFSTYLTFVPNLFWDVFFVLGGGVFLSPSCSPGGDTGAGLVNYWNLTVLVIVKLVLHIYKHTFEDFTNLSWYICFCCSELVFGYKGLQIDMFYTASRLITYVNVKYDEVINPDEYDGLKVRQCCSLTIFYCTNTDWSR